MSRLVAVQRAKVEVGQDVHVVHQERGTVVKERGCPAHASTRVEQLPALVGHLNSDAEVVFVFQETDNLVSEMVHVDHDFVEPGSP